MGKYSCVCRWYLRSFYYYSSRVVAVRLNLSFSVEFLLYLYKALSRSLFCTPPHHVAASGGGGRRGRMVQAGMTNRSVTWCYGDEDDVVVVCELWFVCREWISLPNPFQIGINSLKPICVHRLTHEDVQKVLYLSIQVLQLRVQKKDGVLIPFKKLAGFNSHSFQFAFLHRHCDLALFSSHPECKEDPAYEFRWPNQCRDRDQICVSSFIQRGQCVLKSCAPVSRECCLN